MEMKLLVSALFIAMAAGTFRNGIKDLGECESPKAVVGNTLNKLGMEAGAYLFAMVVL